MSNSEKVSHRKLEYQTKIELKPLNLQRIREELEEHSKKLAENEFLSDGSDEEGSEVTCNATNTVIVPYESENKSLQKQSRKLEYQTKIGLKPLNLQRIREELEEHSKKLAENEFLSDGSDEEGSEATFNATNTVIVPYESENKSLQKQSSDENLKELILPDNNRDTKLLFSPCITPAKNNQFQFKSAIPNIDIFSHSNSKQLLNQDLAPLLHSKINSRSEKPLLKCLVKTPINKSMAVYKHHDTPFEILSEKKQISIPLSISSKPENYSTNRIVVNGTEYIKLSLLGKGGSSEVYHCFNSTENKNFAIKIVKLTETTAESCTNEVKLLKSLQNCNKVIIMYDYEIQDHNLIVVLEKGDKDLRVILRELALENKHIANYKLLFYWMEMLYAVQQMHMNGVIHTDLKPANFIYTESGLKLIDFGIATKVQNDMTFAYKINQEGSGNYISPEALNLQISSNVNSPNYGKSKHKVHFKSDVWSLGCILYQFIYQKTPFQFVNPIWRKLSYIADPKHKIDYPEANWVSSNIIDTVKQCLQYDIKSRPSVNELIHKFENMMRNI